MVVLEPFFNSNYLKIFLFAIGLSCQTNFRTFFFGQVPLASYGRQVA